MKKNNPNAFTSMAVEYSIGEDRVFQSDTKSLEMYICAAELGNVDAYEEIGTYYMEGTVVERDISKAYLFYKVSAKKGSVQAHSHLAHTEQRVGNYQIGIKHLKVLASAGHQEAWII